MNENLRGLRKAMGAIKFEKSQVKQMKRVGTVAMSHMDNTLVLEKGLYYYQGNDFAKELMDSAGTICETCLEHIDNNFNPLDGEQKQEFMAVSDQVVKFIHQCKLVIENNSYSDFINYVTTSNYLNNELSRLKREELSRIQGQSGSIKVSMMYLTIIQETQSIVNSTINILKVSRKFQQEE